jgi:hypothetical protein
MNIFVFQKRCDSVTYPMVELLSLDIDSDVEIIETTPDECHFDNIFDSIPAKQTSTNKFKRPSETMTRSYRPEALTHARFHTKSKASMTKAKDVSDTTMSTIELVRQRHKATRKASEKVRALTTIATAPTNLRLIVNGADVSQTTQLTFLTQPRGDETHHVERINDIDSSIVEFDDIDESSIFVDCDLSTSCSSPCPCPQKAEETVKPLTGFEDFEYDDIGMSSIPNTSILKLLCFVVSACRCFHQAT